MLIIIGTESFLHFMIMHCDNQDNRDKRKEQERVASTVTY